MRSGLRSEWPQIRSLMLSMISAGLVTAVRAQDNIDPQTIEIVKTATVFVRVAGRDWASTGSGFVVSKDDKSVLIATNDHVAMAKPPGLSPVVRPSTLSVVFNSGTRNERSYQAQIVASDADKDLAILRVADVKDPPKPIPFDNSLKLIETLPVISFGFPFGKALSQTKGNPTVTVGRATISSLREGANGELSVIQIDGNLNPGNSGGPIVDLKGQLVGVAVAKIRDGQGIGFAVPASELSRMMQGRVGKVNITSRKEASGSIVVRVDAQLLDPTSKLSSVFAHYLHVAPKDKSPTLTSLEKSPDSKRVELKLDRGTASTEFTLPASDGVMLLQVSASGAGTSVVPGRIQTYSLAPALDPSRYTGSPLPGWKEYRPRDQSFVMWVPENPAKQSERERTLRIDLHRVKINSVTGKTSAGLEYAAESVQLPLQVLRTPRQDIFKLLRESFVKELDGKVTETKEVSSGTMRGEEDTIESKSNVTRVRFYLVGPRFFSVLVSGESELASSADADVILNSYRLVGPSDVIPPGAAAKVTPNPTGRPTPPALNRAGSATASRGPRSMGGGSDKEFQDRGPEESVLVGFEFGLGKFVNNDIIKSARPIFRDGAKETLGKQFGTEFSNMTKVIAKPGYAVGAITVKTGLGVDGLSITFMKLNNGQLNPKESYESEWIGGMGGGGPTKIGGDGTIVVGMLCKKNDKDVTGLGLIYQGDKGTPTPIQGGAFDPEFKDVAPGSALLVGIEIGLGKFLNNDVVKSARPIYREENKTETFGKQYGTELTNVKKVIAKPGFAVGGITVKTGLGVDGISITFMKVTTMGGLDPGDTYESEWVGGNGGGGLVKLGGEGTSVIGITGKSNNRDLTGIGLILK